MKQYLKTDEQPLKLRDIENNNPNNKKIRNWSQEFKSDKQNVFLSHTYMCSSSSC